MNAIEKRARELLASAYADTGAPALLVDEVRGGKSDTASDNAAMRAIIAALTPPEGYVLVRAEVLEDLVSDSELYVHGTEWRAEVRDRKLASAREAKGMLAARPDPTP